MATREDAGQQRPGGERGENGEWGEKVWVLSARSAAGLAGQARRLAEFVAGRPDLDPGDVAWSLAATRSVFERRAVIIGAGREELLSGLKAVAAGEPAAGVVTESAPPGGGNRGRVVFVFSGHGAQWAGMGRELAVCCPVFAARLDECAEALTPFTGWSVEDMLSGAACALECEDAVLPVLWAVSVALAAVWEAAGVVPDAVVGHGQGEIAAACVAGLLSLRDGARVVAGRGRALTAPAGRIPMLSAATGEWVQGPELCSGYWDDGARSPVMFDQAVRVLAASGYAVFAEVSPHPVLTTAIAQALEDVGASGPTVTGTLRRDEGGPGRLLASLAGVHVSGVAVDWAAVLGGGERVDLPTYAFQRQRYWPGSALAQANGEIDFVSDE